MITFRQIRSFFALMRVAARHNEEYFSPIKGCYKDKLDLLKFLNKCIGKNIDGVERIEIDHNYVRIIKYYDKSAEHKK